MTKRKTHSPECKTKVALETIREDLTLVELSKKYDARPNVIRLKRNLLFWKGGFRLRHLSVSADSAVYGVVAGAYPNFAEAAHCDSAQTGNDISN